MSPSSVAYALREEYAGTVHQVEEEGAEPVEVPAFTGGLISLDDERDLDVRAELDANNGVIVVPDHDQSAVIALDAYPALKRVDVPEGAPILGDYEDSTATALKEEAKRRGIAGAGSASKADLVAGLEAFDAITADGENVPADTPLTDLIAGDAVGVDPDQSA